MEVVDTVSNWPNLWPMLVLPVGSLAAALYNLWLWQQDKFILAERSKPVPVLPLVDWPSLPKVSVLVAAWNEADRIEKHVSSFLALRYPNKELILCAGGSDGTYDIASRFAGPGLSVLEQQPHEGKQKALQRCLERASGQIIFLTDADCVFDNQVLELTLRPIVHDGEYVTTGISKPLPQQLSSPFVCHRWFADLYANSHYEDYIDGILGRNAALRREALKAVGEFQSRVETGTDYHLAKNLLAKGFRIRFVRQSAIETHYPHGIVDSWNRQTRWLRNVVMHGLRFGAYKEAMQCLVPSVIGLLMLIGPLAGFRLGWAAIAVWLLAWIHVLLSRIRYMRFGELATSHSFRLTGYLRLALYTIVDFGIWAVVLLQYPTKRWRTRW